MAGRMCDGPQASAVGDPVKHLRMLVTSEGRWVLEDSDDFLAAVGDPNPDYDAMAFAVKNLGFIKFQIFDESIIEVELHPRNVQLPALLAVQQQLLTSPARLFRMKHFDTAWRSEIMTSAERAISRLSELCAPAFAPPPRERFTAEPQAFSSLFTDENSPLRPFAQKWRVSFGYFDPSVISFAIEHQLLSRMMIAGVRPRTMDPVFRFIGDGFKSLDHDYPFHAIGERIENLPDKEYGGWVAEFYKSVARTAQPHYDVVTAAIEARPASNKFFVTRYERLLLPWKTPSDEVLVTVVSKTLGAEKAGERSASAAQGAVFNNAAKSS
jgi:hypothetical protein